MAEISPPGAPTAPAPAASDAAAKGRDGAAESRAVATIPARNGQPIAEVPPLVELVEFVDRPAAARPLPSGQRPVRRNFLAPVSHQIDGPPSLPHLRPRGALRSELPALPPPHAPDRLSSPPAPASGFAPAPTSGPPRRGRRRVAVAAGLAIALGLAVAVQLQVDLATLGRLQALAMQQLAPAPVLSNTDEPPVDPVQRATYYAARARAGDASAQLALAILHAKGDGVEQDYATAAKWFRIAAESGVMRAQYDLGVLYERGRGVPLDYPQAVVWYRKAAEQNHPLAQYNLAVAYTKGQGVRRDFFEAAVWYHRAAAQGVVAAMVNLAILYERGEGLDASAVDAYAWYRAAARRGSQPAARRAEELLQALPLTEQSRAEAKTADINASVRDAIGERARAAAKSAPPAPAAAEDGSPSVLKSGIERRWNSPRGGDARAENP